MGAVEAKLHRQSWDHVGWGSTGGWMSEGGAGPE